MKNSIFSIALIFCIYYSGKAQNPSLLLNPSKVDFDAYEKLVAEVKQHRKTRVISLDDFKKKSQQKNVIILDTRSDEMFKRKHVKGAIHLNFSDFTQANLARIIPSSDYTILIYCNNNFDKDPINFATKAFIPAKKTKDSKELTLALNIPTYINLYGYGYKNVYELGELVNVYDGLIEFEGTEIEK